MAHVAPTSHRRASRSSRRRRRGTGQPGTNQTDTNQPGTNQRGASQRGTSRGGAHQAGARRAATDRAGAHTDQLDGDWVDGPIQTRTWLGLTFAFVLGLVLTAQAHVGVHAAGITLLVMLVPLTVGVLVTAFRRGFGSGTAALTTGAALAFVLLKFFF
jgi:hypothetical protein